MEKRKTVLIVVPRLAGGGQERMAAMTADVLMDEYDVAVIIFSNEGMIYSTNAEIINLDIPSERHLAKKIIRQFKRIAALKKIRKEKSADFVYSIGNTANITNVFSACQGKTIVSIRGYANIRKNIIDGFIYRRADKVICISAAMKRKLYECYPSIGKKTKILYNGIKLDQIQELSLKPGTDQILPIGKKIVAAGRLTDVKGFRQLLRSFALLHRRNHDVSLYILGDGENREDLTALSKQLGIEGCVFFLGFQKNLYVFMKQCDVFVLSSIHEGFGNVIVEAMACGLPVVSAACLAGPAEILGADNYSIDKLYYAEYGILVPAFLDDFTVESDKELIMSQAMEVLSSNDALRRKYALKSLERAEDFSISQYSGRLHKLFLE